jgi:dihydrofolate synthase/folylpolyglutamate synthase
MKSSFEQFIEEKPLYYKEIDHKRVHKAYAILKPHIKQPLTIHVVGTNGKGSTGRIIASLIHFAGVQVGHFSSPHILKFNERIWIEGQDIEDAMLEAAHEKLFAIIGKEVSDGLSYFEYTTLLALVAMENLEVIILEAGLGGEFDATNVCSKSLSIITPIGLDHQDFLGESIEEIARTKMNSIQNRFVLSYQVHDEVYKVADKIVDEKDARLYDVSEWLNAQDEKYQCIQKEALTLKWSEYLFENALSAIYALEILELNYKIEDLRKVKLFGRFYQYSDNVRLDVGHNFLAAQAIVSALKGISIKPILIYNSLEDKDYESILKLFKPHIEAVQIIEIETDRAVDKATLEFVLNKLEIPHSNYDTLEEDKEYLVFGSFYVVESFLNTQL